MVAELELVVSSPADRSTPPESEPDSLMCSLSGLTSVVGDRSIVSPNVIVNIPVPSFSADETNVGATLSAAATLPPLAGAFVPVTDWSTTSPDNAT